MSKTTKKIKSTKKKTSSDLVTSKKILSTRVLPSKKDILRYYLWLEGNCFSTIVKNVIDIWKTAGIATVTPQMVMKSLKKLHHEFRHYDNRRSTKKSKNFQQEQTAFKRKLDQLFDIALCKCSGDCTCPENTMSENQRKFLLDQRTTKRMKITEVGKPSTDVTNLGDTECDSSSYESNSSSSEVDEDDDFVVMDRNAVPKKYNTINLTPIAVVADRYGKSDRVVAAIATATLQVAGKVSKDDNVNVIDRHKVYRWRNKVRTHFSSEPNKEFMALYFDGRKDRTLFMEKGSQNIIRKVFHKEEHISMIGEPGGHYLGHASLKRGKALDIAVGISKAVGMFMDFWAIGCDGTVTNTGAEGGTIRKYEIHLKHPLQWLICQLHFNELPLRALFVLIDGPTTGPDSFTGVIGKALNDSVNLPIVKFRRIAVNLPKLKYDMKSNELSTDQQYLYEITEAISKGVVSGSLAQRNPGKVHNSRWLTLANNILRIYVGTKNPSQNLIDIVNYILKVYVPAWFKIKMNHASVDGPENLLYIIRASRYLKKEYRDTVDASIQRNAFFAHPENILLAMLHDNEKSIRQQAHKKILIARTSQNASENVVRIFEIPEVNFKAETYSNLIDWRNIHITEPPLIKHFFNAELQDLVDEGENSDLWHYDGFELPNHTQAVERCVKLVTETCLKVSGEERRDGYIRATLHSRSLMKSFNTKKEFQNYSEIM
jgi:hypothetical protein